MSILLLRMRISGSAKNPLSGIVVRGPYVDGLSSDGRDLALLRELLIIEECIFSPMSQSISLEIFNE